MFKNIILLLRLHNTIPVLMLFLPCLWGILVANKQTMYINQGKILIGVFIFLAGSVLMRSAGCVINDLFDKNLDIKQKRSKNRPIANKSISSKIALLIFLSITLICGIFVLLVFNKYAIIYTIIAGILMVIYPLTKRFFSYPQLVLGFAFNSGVVISYVFYAKFATMPILLLYASGIYWTMIYDTIYAYQDLIDDIKLGVFSSARKFGIINGKKYLKIFSTMQTFCLILAGISLHTNLYYYFIIAINFVIIRKIIATTDLVEKESCSKSFKLMAISGVLVSLAILIS
jgi:4-hydroxybenzoate polyprenyl transferase